MVSGGVSRRQRNSPRARSRLFSAAKKRHTSFCHPSERIRSWPKVKNKSGGPTMAATAAVSRPAARAAKAGKARPRTDQAESSG